MDRMYRHQRHIYDASRKYYLAGRDEAIARLQARPGDKVLEIGCGTGRNLVKAAKVYPQARLYGLDVSRAMLDTAAASIARAGLSSRVAIAEADAVAFDPQALFGHALFERVMISYALSMIPPWREALGRALGVVAPGGALHIVDFGDFRGLPRPFGMALRHWLAAFGVTPRDDLGAALAALTVERGLAFETQDWIRGYATLAVARREEIGTAPGVASPVGQGLAASAAQTGRKENPWFFLPFFFGFPSFLLDFPSAGFGKISPAAPVTRRPPTARSVSQDRPEAALAICSASA